MRQILAALAVSMVPFAAGAADLGLRKSLPPETSGRAKAGWTGVYAGVSGGWGQGAIKDGSDAHDPESIKLRGMMGGVQVGYNHQIGDFVVGVETDLSLGKAKGSLGASGDLDQFAVSGKVEGALQSFGTLRARAGVTVNSALFFATAGYAYGLVKLTGSATVVDNSNGTTGSAALSDSQWANGWTAGVGVEYAFTPQISAKIEYLYADLGKTVPFKGTLSETPILTKLNLIRAGVNYRF